MASCWWGGRNNSAVMGGLSKASLLAHALMRCVLWYICKGRLGVFWLKNTVFGIFIFLTTTSVKGGDGYPFMVGNVVGVFQILSNTNKFVQ